MSLKAKLNRLKPHLTREAPRQPEGDGIPGGAVSSPAASDTASLLEIPYREKWAGLQAKPYVLDGEYVMVREVRYPVTARHGAYTFAQLYETIDAWERAGIRHPLSAAGKTAEDLLFFDTETTGLHGGAGNAVFLLGHSRFEGDCVVVRQHFLTAPHAEAALYHSFLEAARTATDLVTYNGKSFDWPQVKTRHTLLRDLVPRLPSFGHYDLLHGARRLWREDLESCRLSLIEQEKLGVRRENDLPGYLAPIRYFDYLTDKDPDTIKGVLAHNEMDVLSLITLYIRLSSLLLAWDREDVSAEERFNIARWYEALGDGESALRAYRLVATSGHPLGVKATIAMGHCYKRQKDWKQAMRLWEEVVRSGSYVSEDVYVELAKIYEHHLKDYEQALHCTLRAFDLWKKKSSLLRRKSKAEEAAYRKRIERLEQRLEQHA